jgi:hypothetical protein
MTPRPFHLHPFRPAAEAATAPLELQLRGELQLLATADPSLQLTFVLEGRLPAVRLAGPGDPPIRRDDLWKTTCIEFFLAAPGEDPYWEFNLSPSGDWNVYHFRSYRSGGQPETFYSSLPFELHRAADSLELLLRCPLPPPLASAGRLQASVTAVIESRQGALSYWALHHPAPEPDFHDRLGFRLTLEPGGGTASGPQEFRHQPRP